MRRLVIFILALAVAGGATAYVAMRSDQFVDDLTGRNVTVMVATREIPANNPVSLSKDIRLQQIDRADVPAGAIVIASESGRDPDLRPYSGHVASRTIANGAFVRFGDLVPPGSVKTSEKKEEVANGTPVVDSERQLDLLRSDPAVIMIDEEIARRASLARTRELQFVYSTSRELPNETVVSEEIIVEKATLQSFDRLLAGGKTERIYYVRLPESLAARVSLIKSGKGVHGAAGNLQIRPRSQPRLYGGNESFLCSGLRCVEVKPGPEQDGSAQQAE
jgi:hypothetical protein